MIWFTEFQRELSQSIDKVKISKDSLFEAFIKMITETKKISPVLKKMQDYIKENNLFENHSKMMNMLMYDYGNQHMVMKSKNPKYESESEEEGDQPDVI